jgi:hypothetical protein
LPDSNLHSLDFGGRDGFGAKKETSQGLESRLSSRIEPMNGLFSIRDRSGYASGQSEIDPFHRVW